MDLIAEPRKGIQYVTCQSIVFGMLLLICGMTEERVDNAAHIGGLIAGILIAILIYRKQTIKKEAAPGEN